MTPLFWGLVGIFVIADLIFLPPIIARARRLEMDDGTRASAPGQLARLGDGITHYQWHGPKTGEVIVLVHGLSAPSFVFSGLIPHLTSAGNRVLTYDLFGRGWSDRPRNRQTGAFFARQLDELLRDQMVSRQVTVLGYSMGGAIAPHFACLHPGRVSKLVLVAPAGFGHDLGRLTGFMVAVPVVGDWLMGVFGGSALRRAARRERDGGSIPDIAERMVRETRYRGYARSILSSLRNLLRRPITDLHVRLATARVPVLAIWGRLDETIAVAHAGVLGALNPTARNVIYDDSDHGMTYREPARLAETVLEFLKKDG
jgi:pimeloyl-ACP methyl ester carboxylesterase